jgi:hypothetical protein
MKNVLNVRSIYQMGYHHYGEILNRLKIIMTNVEVNGNFSRLKKNILFDPQSWVKIMKTFSVYSRTDTIYYRFNINK